MVTNMISNIIMVACWIAILVMQGPMGIVYAAVGIFLGTMLVESFYKKSY